MIIISDIKRVSREVVEYQLENGDKIILLESQEREMEESHESKTFESVEGKEYFAVLSEVEFTDDLAEIIGFEFIRDLTVEIPFEQALEIIHARTGRQFEVGSNGKYVTFYENLQAFVDERGMDNDETRAEAFERITDHEWASLNIDSEQPFIAYDDSNASYSFWFLTKTDEQSINDFINKIK